MVNFVIPLVFYSLVILILIVITFDFVADALFAVVVFIAVVFIVLFFIVFDVLISPCAGFNRSRSRPCYRRRRHLGLGDFFDCDSCFLFTRRQDPETSSTK